MDYLKQVDSLINIDLEKDIKSISDVRGITRVKLYYLGEFLLKKLVDYNFDSILNIEDFFYDLNYILDSEIKKHEEIFDSYYNIFVLNYLADLFQFLNKKQKANNKFDYFINKKPYANMIEILLKEKVLSHKELAENMNISVTNLTNYINKIKDLGIVTVNSLEFNKKAKYYRLSFDLLKYLNQNDERAVFLINKRKYDKDYKKNISSCEKYNIIGYRR